MISNEEMNENSIKEVPKEILLAAENLKEDLLPEKSRKRYEKEYTLFCKWSKEKRNVNFEKEEVFLAYFLRIIEIVPAVHTLVKILNVENYAQAEKKCGYWYAF